MLAPTLLRTPSVHHSLYRSSAGAWADDRPRTPAPPAPSGGIDGGHVG